MDESSIKQHLQSFRESCDIRMKSVLEKVTDLEKNLYGNGKVGLMDRVSQVEYVIAQLAEERTERRRLWWGVVGTLITAVIIAGATFVLSMVRQQESMQQTEKGIQEVKSLIMEESGNS